MARRGKRTLTPEEQRLWEQVAASAEPLGDGAKPNVGAAGRTELSNAARVALNLPVVQPASADPTPSIARQSPARRSAPTAPSVEIDWRPAETRPIGRPEAGIDRRTADRIRKGARDPDARIDLHGMTAERAHRACLAFVSDALNRGHRMVLVITGKGRSSSPNSGNGSWGEPRGVIRNALPGWLKASPLWRETVGIYEAHPRHGGAGAVYIYLKRRR